MPRMLVVDDEAAILRALDDYFRARGFAVDCASALDEARRLLEEDAAYSVIVTDLKLGSGGSEGLDLVRLARDRQPQAGIILLTAYGSPEVESEAMACGADAVLTKPQPLRELARVAAAALVGKGEAPRVAKA